MSPCLLPQMLETHFVHVSYRHLSTWSLAILSSSCYVCHQYSCHCVLCVLSHHRPTPFQISVVLCYFGCCSSKEALIYSLLIRSFFVIPHIHLNILNSFVSILASCPCITGQVPAPYSCMGLTVVFMGLQHHWHLPTAFLPVSPTCTHSLLDLRFHASFLFHD